MVREVVRDDKDRVVEFLARNSKTFRFGKKDPSEVFDLFLGTKGFCVVREDKHHTITDVMFCNTAHKTPVIFSCISTSAARLRSNREQYEVLKELTHCVEEGLVARIRYAYGVGYSVDPLDFVKIGALASLGYAQNDREYAKVGRKVVLLKRIGPS